ncbi:MAG: demethoxyubiquinone hydroxylase family protein, partial [Gammaproteobacteria bacterium]|nr:demethoxyubiquinone hydroxylase family protein [Gammaproteobacteria bacterium]
MKNSRLGFLDLLVSGFDQALRTASGLQKGSGRANPASETSADSMAREQRRHVAGLMRVNHSGEVAAQALYQGQAMTARLENVREAMEQAAREE